MEKQQIREAWQYYQGNTWEFWIGALGDEGTENGRRHKESLQKMFQSVNLIEDIVERKISALIGKQPIFAAMGAENTEEIALQEFASKLYQDLLAIPAEMPSQKLLFANCWKMFLTCALVQGTGYLRICQVDRGEIGIHAVDPAAIEVLERDQLGRLKSVAYTFQEKDEEFQEIQTITPQGLSIEYKDENRANIFIPNFFKLGIIELRRESIITPSLKKLENALNHSATQIPRNNELSTASARIITNAEVPKKKAQNAQGEEVMVVDPDAIILAPGAITFLRGFPLVSETGEPKGFTTPGVTSDDPIDVAPFTTSVNLFQALALQKGKQGYILADNLDVSGRSRVELRNEFVKNLGEDALPLAKAIADALCVAWVFSGNNSQTRLSVTLQIDIGKPSPEERSAIQSAYQAGLLSRQSAIALQQYVTDSQEELALIEQENATLESKPNSNNGAAGEEE